MSHAAQSRAATSPLGEAETVVAELVRVPPTKPAPSGRAHVEPASSHPIPAWLASGTLLLLALFASGCGGQTSVQGGTRGVVLVGGAALPEIQVTIHKGTGADAFPIGFGVTRDDGQIELLATEATGPLWLPSGEYGCTVESIGPPLEFPRDYRDPAKTPLKITWTEGDQPFQLDIPDPAKTKGRR
jgi:hypothetical protein